MLPFLLNLIPGVGILNSLIQAAFEFLKPVFKVLGEFIAWFFKEIVWEGLKDILDSLPTALLVGMMIFGTAFYYNNFGPKRTACEAEITKLVKQIQCMRAKKCK